MATIAILPEPGADNLTTFSAVTAGHKATGRTAGEALDALTAQLTADEAAAPVIIQPFQPDQFFSAAQRDHLSALMARWHAARETGEALSPGEQAELERLVDEEVQGSTERAKQTRRDLEVSRAMRRSIVELMEEGAMLAARHEREGRLVSRFQIGNSIAQALGLLLLFLLTVVSPLSFISIYFEIILLTLIISLAAEASLWGLLRRRDAALKRAAEKSSADNVEQKEPSKAR